MKTPVGSTDNFLLKRLVLQGTVFAPLKCTVQLETFSKECYTRDNGYALYKYKGCVNIPPLQMVDDILVVSKCGVQAVFMNAILNAKIEEKKLRLSYDKCNFIHISKKKNTCFTSLKVHSKIMTQTENILYLGDVI